VTVYISDVNGKQPRLAIPDFMLPGADAELSAAARTIAGVLWDDLEFEQEFYLLPPDVARAVPRATSATALPLDEWTQRGADYVLVGSLRRSVNDLPVDIHVISVGGGSPGKDVFARTYGCQAAHLRACAHTIADSLHKHLRNADGVAMSRLAFTSDRAGGRASAVFHRPSKEIYIADYDGENVAPVTNNHLLNISPAWSPDGKLLAYVSYAPQADIYVKSVYEARQAWRIAGGPATADNFGPVFSPDGTQVAFYSNRDGNYQIYVGSADGKTPARRLTVNRTYEQSPTWAPHGSRIAFTSDRIGAGTPLLYVMNTDGTGQTALACGARCDRPSWSPLGDLIAFTCGTNRPYNICTVNVRTGALQQLLPNDGHTNEQPVFAPNGKHIAFTTSRYGKDEIAIMDTKGKIQRRVTRAGNNSYPSWSKSR
jgi:TolB protein